MKNITRDIWVLVQHNRDSVEESTFGLIAEARRIISDAGGSGTVTAILMGIIEDEALNSLKKGGADRIIYVKHEGLERYHGELYSRLFHDLTADQSISLVLLSRSEGLEDFSARIAAMMNASLVTRAMDLKIDKQGGFTAARPVSNGYLFEKVRISTGTIPIISFLPSALSVEGDFKKPDDVSIEVITPEIDEESLKIRVTNVIKAIPEDQEIEDADIVVSAGRGAGKEEAFNVIHELARVIGGSVGGTRPVIDSLLLPFERQIGQTGKTVAPDLIFNCGISGANEYSAGMEKSKKVISINKDPRARIFRFSDLGVVGDLKEILPLLIERIKSIKEG
ncbi:electron transfer flavoprotein subunit alpha/FixB family protein [Thermodesulfobacteriota bacterium]